MKALRILAANDQASFRQKMQEMTQAIPWASIVAEAKNGLEAIELVKQHRPDVVLMDIVMPGMSGIEARIGEMGFALLPIQAYNPL